MDGLMDRWMDGLMDSRMNCWIDGYLDEWMDKRTDGKQTDTHRSNTFSPTQAYPFPFPMKTSACNLEINHHFSVCLQTLHRAQQIYMYSISIRILQCCDVRLHRLLHPITLSLLAPAHILFLFSFIKKISWRDERNCSNISSAGPALRLRATTLFCSLLFSYARSHQSL